MSCTDAAIESAEIGCGGMCAAVALVVLGDLFRIKISKEMYISGLGVRFPGTLGAAQCAFAGTAIFIAHLARRQGLEQDEIIDLCDNWQGVYEEQMVDLSAISEKSPLELSKRILETAYMYLAQCRHFSDLTEGMLKPKKYYDNIYTDREGMFMHSPYALEEKLTKAVISGDEKLALMTLQKINARGEKAILANNPLRSAKNSMIGSIAFLARATIQAGVNANDAFSLSDALTQQVEEMTDRSAVLMFEEHILLQFIMLVRHRIDESYSPPVIKAIHYINNHLDSKISLSQASEYAAVHPAYLSVRFKREAGIAFTEYVSMRKIQESSYFVRHTSYPISQISSLYGFSSQSYYITTFKKVFGETPMDYRKRPLSK